MCGIFGVITEQNKISMADVLARMGRAIVHRGPDSSGIWIDDTSSVGLGHRRLAIHDLSPGGHQPMLSSDGRYCLVFNGEIYNFKKMRDDLSLRDYHFVSDSDTEVLLASIITRGIESTLSEIEGMFAFALWDKVNDKLTLCRDRLGEKPLYYGWLGSNFIFASELSAIEAMEEPLKIDRESLREYFFYGYVPAPRSIYSGIYKLMPGTSIDISPKKWGREFSNLSFEERKGLINQKSYWKVASQIIDKQSHSFSSDSEAIPELDGLLRHVIYDQSSADVPLGAFLSGGVDSSVVVALMQQVNSRPAKTFTIGFKEKEFNEARFANDIARHLKTEHTELYIDGNDCLDLAPKLSQIYDEPIADSSQIPTYLVSKLARESVTVCLSGDGGDELFAGYNRYLWSEKAWNKFKIFPPALRNGLGSLMSTVPSKWWDTVYRFMRAASIAGGNQSNVALKIQKLITLLKCNDITEVYLYLISYWQENALPLKELREIEKGLFYSHESLSIPNFIDRAMYWDQLSYLPGDNLTKVDRASMALSLETRLPLLNHKVVEFAWGVPLDMKIKDGQSKWLLRQVLYQYVPKALIERPKMGFSVPVSAWLRGPLKEWGESLLRHMDESVFNKTLIWKYWNQHQTQVVDHGNKLWALLMFLDWAESRSINL